MRCRGVEVGHRHALECAVFFGGSSNAGMSGRRHLVALLFKCSKPRLDSFEPSGEPRVTETMSAHLAGTRPERMKVLDALLGYGRRGPVDAVQLAVHAVRTCRTFSIASRLPSSTGIAFEQGDIVSSCRINRMFSFRHRTLTGKAYLAAHRPAFRAVCGFGARGHVRRIACR